MAPERLIRGTLNASGDIYCVGVVLFELLTGRHPYPERGPAQLLSVLGTDAPRPSTLVADLPSELDDITSRAMSRDPSLRYQSARELGRDLRRVLTFIEVSALSPPTTRPGNEIASTRRDPAFWVLAGVTAVPALLIVLAILGFATLIMYDSPLGRTGEFAPESPLWWPWRGFECLVAPTYAAVQVGIVILFIQFLGRLLHISAFSRVLAPVRAVVDRTLAAVRAQPVAVLAPSLLFLQLAFVGVSLWRFDAIFEGLSSFITRPGNRLEQNDFTKAFSRQVVVFGLAWYVLIRHRRRRGERDGVSVIAAGLAVTVFSLLAGQIFPRQIIYKNKHERASYDSQRCYVTGQQSEDVLLFCPHQPPPWTRIIKAGDPAFKREGVVESIFSGFDATK
jgi:hypothetical protein